MSYFTEDTRAESFLTSRAVKKRYEEALSFDKLPKDFSKHNRGRPESQQKVERAVADYASRMLSGSKAPAVILWQKDDGTVEVLDGCQRLLAAQSINAATFAAYVVRCQENTAQMIRVFANTALNGAAQVDPEWTLETMISEFVINGDESVESVAEFMNLKKSTVLAKHNIMLAKKKIHDALQQNGGLQDVKLRQLNDGLCQVVLEKAEEALDLAPAEAAIIIRNGISKYELSNGDFGKYLDEIIPKKLGRAGKSPAVQLRSKIREITESPYWKSREKGRRTRSEATAVVKEIKDLETAAKKMREAKASWHTDSLSLVVDMHERIIEIGKILRQCCDAQLKHSADMQFAKMALFTFER